ncbi:protein LLP homolog [Rhipicephalus microplus]|uniref:protein LLP homolog n=1 Tax=Rhipicephalus microplus TaxID=6941 RepID=UPI003F6C7B16
MAKSLRSKWKRKMRAKKRERYSVKELAKLKEMLDAAASTSKSDVDMSEMCTVVDGKQVADQSAESNEPLDAEADGQATAEMDVDKPVRKYNPRTLRDEHGTYPVWMSQRAIRKRKAKQGRGKSRKSASHKGIKKNKKRKSSR